MRRRRTSVTLESVSGEHLSAMDSETALVVRRKLNMHAVRTDTRLRTRHRLLPVLQNETVS